MFGLGKKKIDMKAPMGGQIVPITEVPDPMFAERMLGDGFAIQPPDNCEMIDVLAPAAGKIAKVFGTRHAVALITAEGVELLVHIGLETVELKGEGFEALVSTGDQVEAGQPLIRVDCATVRAAGAPLITPVVFTKGKQVASLSVKSGSVEAGSPVATVTLA